MRKAVVAALAVAVGAVGCFPQGMCESAFRDYCSEGDPTCQGHIVGSSQWQSGPIDGKWLAFGAEQTILMHLRDAVTGQTLSGKPLTIYEAVSAVETQTSSGPFPAINAGNLGEWDLGPDSSSGFVRNDTCSSDFVYVVVTLDPATATIAGPADAGTGDASTDGAVE